MYGIHFDKVSIYCLHLQKEYKKALELEIRGKGLTELALETPDFVRAKNATDIASQVCVNISYVTSDAFFKGKFMNRFFLIKPNENCC